MGKTLNGKQKLQDNLITTNLRFTKKLRLPHQLDRVMREKWGKKID
jgi:hypothetical protein